MNNNPASDPSAVLKPAIVRRIPVYIGCRIYRYKPFFILFCLFGNTPNAVPKLIMLIIHKERPAMETTNPAILALSDTKNVFGNIPISARQTRYEIGISTVR